MRKLAEKHGTGAASVAAERCVAEANGLGEGAVEAIVNGIGTAVVFPPAVPFVVGLSLAAGVLEWVGQRLKRADEPMPAEWFPVVSGCASDDGRFFVGRLLATKGWVSQSDAVSFIAVERAAKPRAAVDPIALVAAPENARAALLEHYEASRTAFDRAVALAGGSLLSAGSYGANVAAAAFRAARQKWRIGF